MYKEEAIFLRAEKRAWEINDRKGIAYSVFVLMGGFVYKMKATEEQYNEFADVSQKQGDVAFLLTAVQEKAVLVFKDFK